MFDRGMYGLLPPPEVLKILLTVPLPSRNVFDDIMKKVMECAIMDGEVRRCYIVYGRAK